ncbi:MAG: tetratricopeptide repeat protein [Pseudomonadota bacterium]
MGDIFGSKSDRAAEQASITPAEVETQSAGQWSAVRADGDVVAAPPPMKDTPLEETAAATEAAAEEEAEPFGGVFGLLADAVGSDDETPPLAPLPQAPPAQSAAAPNVQAAAASLTRERARARNLTNQRQHSEAVDVWRGVVASGGSENDQLDLIASLVRSERWDAAEAELDRFPQARNTERGLMLSAIVYDQQERWQEADKAYADALAVSSAPHVILNNWGVSAMSRGQHEAASDLFVRALRHRPDFANAKANLALARGLTGDYSLPAVEFSEAEKAAVLHDLGLIAYRRGELDEAEQRFRAALETHPRYYRKAADMLLKIEKTRGGVADL